MSSVHGFTINTLSNKTYNNPKLNEKMKKLYLDETSADVFFVFDDKMKTERVPAHKNLLFAGTDAFSGMFYGDMKELGDIKMVDVSVAGFKEFLQFFYNDKIELTMDNIHEVVYLGDKYIVSDCLNVCKQFLKESLTNESACHIYAIAIRFNFIELQNLCQAHITKNAVFVVQSSSFVECEKSVLKRILGFNMLFCKEVVLFNACMAWVKAESKQEMLTRKLIDQHLGELFFEIRFGSMTIQEFAALIPMYGPVFTIDEYQEIIQVIGMKTFKPNIFKGGARQILSAGPTDSKTSFIFSFDNLTNTKLDAIKKSPSSTAFSFASKPATQ